MLGFFQSAFRGSFVLTKVSLGHDCMCPLYGGLSAFRGPFLGGCLSISTTLKSIGGNKFVRCMEVVHFSESSL